MKKSVKKTMILLILLTSGLLGFFFSLYHHAYFARPIQKPLPDTEIRQTFHYPAIFVKQLAGDPEAGRKIFKEFCAACHDKEPMIDVHAPRIGDKKAWAARRQLGMTVLLKMTTQGMGAMPARGGCFECSDQQLRETIRYMLGH